MHSFWVQNNMHLLVDRPELVVVGLIFVCCFGWIDFWVDSCWIEFYTGNSRLNVFYFNLHVLW